MDESENKSSGPVVLVLLAIIGMIGLIASAIPKKFRWIAWESSNACINNLRQIDGAISEWALEKGKTKGTVVTENDLTNYIKLNRYGKIPPCPAGGKYTYGKVGNVPQITCSLSTANPPHKLP